MDRLWVKMLLYPTVGVVVFLLFLWLTFPNDELEKIAKTNLEAALGNQYDVSFGSFGLSGLTGLAATEVTLQSKPPPLDLSEEERKQIKRVNMTLDALELDVALFKSLLGKPEADFEVVIQDGTLEGTYAQVEYEPVKQEQPASASARARRRPTPAKGKDAAGEDAADEEEAADEEAAQGDTTDLGHHIEAEFTDIPLRGLSLLQAYTGAPLGGTLGGTLSALTSKAGRLLELETDLTVARVSYGPGELPFDTGFGKFKLNTPLKVGDLSVKVHVEDGKLIIDEIATTGPDLILEAEGNIRLGPGMASSRAQINARLKPSQDFLKANDLAGILDLSPKVRNAKAGDWYGVLISGPLTRLSYHPSSRTASGLTKTATKRSKK